MTKNHCGNDLRWFLCVLACLRILSKIFGEFVEMDIDYVTKMVYNKY